LKRFLFPLLGIVLLVVTVTQVNATRSNTTPARTDAAAPVREIAAEGRLVAYPGSEVTVGSDAAGTLVELRIDEKDVVHKGDVIAIVKADDTRAELAEARSRVGEAEADIRLFEMESARAKSLWENEVGSKQAWEKAERDIDAARARRSSAIAAVNRIEAVVAKTIIRAPISGTVISRLVDAGERITEGEAVVTLADLGRTRVEAEVDEFDAARVALGAPVKITAEGFERTWTGRIEEIPDAVTSRRLKPQDPSKPIDTRVLLVKVAVTDSAPLKLGQRVEVRITSR
jgi:HlyD family secretion protein